MTDLALMAMEPRFPADPRGVPTGVEGFMLFGDGNPNIGGPPRPGPRY